MSRLSGVRLGFLALLVAASRCGWAHADCPPQWQRFDLTSTPDDYVDEVRTSIIFDNGTGPALYVAGRFYEAAAGGRWISSLRRSTAGPFTRVGGLLSGGNLSTPGDIRALAVYNDGGGSALYAAGTFIGEIPVGATEVATQLNSIAKWNGASWTPLYQGFTNPPISGVGLGVLDLHVHDDGSGQKLYAVGDFTYVNSRARGAVGLNGIARWNGNDWESVGTPAGGMDGSGWPICMTTHDFDGTGPQPPKLVVGGAFATLAGGSVPADRLAVWDGTSWSALPPLPQGSFGFVTALASFDDDGPGPRGPSLFVGTGSGLGDGTGAYGGADWRTIFKLEGTQWVMLEPGPIEPLNTSTGAVRSMEVFDDGTGPALFIGCSMSTFYGLGLGQPNNQPPLSHYGRTLRKWNGTVLTNVGGGVFAPTNPTAQDPFDACSASTLCSLAPLGRQALFVGGLFSAVNANAIPANNGALWTVPASCCRADFNNAGGVTVQDIFDFLSAWFAGAPRADFNDAGGVTVQDIFDFLSAWFQGCP